ncbi:MAG: prephenate dehydrogenase [Bdellovibrionales bacterium]
MTDNQKKTVGLLGLGSFGQLMARHLLPHFTLQAYDPASEAKTFADAHGIAMLPPDQVAKADVVIIGAPVPRMEEAIASIKDHLSEGTLVLDVGSVKVKPAALMLRDLPSHVDLIATHPLFGPQSGKNGIEGQKIVLCPLRCPQERVEKLKGFLETALALKVIMATPDEHDREAAVVFGLTHLVSKMLVQDFEPFPIGMTTKSYELLIESVNMVRFCSPELFLAIECENPYVHDVSQTFFAKADALRQYLEENREKA